MSVDDDDKPTVVLDLNALKKQKLKQEEELANIESELEFNVNQSPSKEAAARPAKVTPIVEPDAIELSEDSELFAEQFLDAREKSPSKEVPFPVILFDFQSDFFEKNKAQFPQGLDYQIAKSLPELNKFLAAKTFQIVVFNYDVNPKAVNQLTAQIKQKFPLTKTLILARAISPEKAKIHAKTISGANGYYQLPLNAEKIKAELLKIKSSNKVS